MATLENNVVNVLQKVRMILNPKAYEKFVDRILDTVEDAIEESDTKLDDMALKPLIKATRVMLGVEDNDEPEAPADDDSEDAGAA